MMVPWKNNLFALFTPSAVQKQQEKDQFCRKVGGGGGGVNSCVWGG